MESFIFVKEGSLTNEQCDEILHYFELENHYDGATVSGVNKTLKNTKEFSIPILYESNSIWKKIVDSLIAELNISLISYKKKLVNELNITTIPDSLFIDGMSINKYIKNEGHYVYHTDNNYNSHKKSSRKITFLWYLNMVNEGGETEFFGGTYKIKPETGKLVLFPAQWTIPHCAKVPISNNKYIITGWFYHKI
jgi:hypothetical protein